MLFTFPSRYWFAIGHWAVFSLGRRSSRLPTGFLVSRRTQDPLRRAGGFGYRALACFGRPFQAIRLPPAFLTPCGVSYNPGGQALRFGLFPFRSPLLRKSHLLSLPPGTEMFQFPGSALPSLWIQKGILPVRAGGSPIRKSPDLRLLTAPRSLSEFVPSFVGSQCQGIHRALLFA